MLRTLLMSTSLMSSICRMADDGNGSDGDLLDAIEFEENLGDVEKPPELPAGVYVGEVQDVQKQVSTKGNSYFAIKFVIPPENIPADLRDGFPDGAVLYWNRQVVPKAGDRRAMFNLRKLVESLGLSVDTNTVDPNEWMGRPAKLRVRMGKWQGEDRAEIAAVEVAESQRRESRTETRGKPAAGGRAARGRR